jgi:hypothetical protein
VGTPKTVTASYAGDANFGTSVSTGTAHDVGQALTATSITSSLTTPTVVGEAYSVGFAVAVQSPGAGTPTGLVTVSDGTGATCSALVSVGTCSLISTTASAKTVTASYAGDGNFGPSVSAGTAHTVNPVTTTTGITSLTNPTVFGEGVTFTATVAQTVGTAVPTGSVQFQVDGNNLDTAVTLAGGMATSVSVDTLAVGTHAVTATYTPDNGNFVGSTTPSPLTQTVNAPTTTTGLTPPVNTSVFGQRLTLTAALAPTPELAFAPRPRVSWAP